MKPCKDFEGRIAEHNGHGVTSKLKHRTQSASIIAYIDAYGPVPEGKQVNHRCGRGICIEPEHLYAGTHSQNMVDASVQGTLNTVKLTEDEVREIRSLCAAGMKHKDIALAFDIAKITVSEINYRKTWKSTW